MKRLLLFTLLLIAAAGLRAQSTPDPNEGPVRSILLDSSQTSLGGRDRNVTFERTTKVGLENLLGLSEVHAMAVISHYDHSTLADHPGYPFIKKVIRITNFRRWDAPVTLYVFIDSQDVVCRLNYILGSATGITPEEAHSVFEHLAKGKGQMNYVPDSQWEIAGWDSKEKTCLFSWQKGIPMVNPSYLLTLKSYLNEHLLPYMKNHELPNDGIFTAAAKMQIGQEAPKN